MMDETIQINCLIVDDEPLSRDVLKRFIEDTPYLTLLGACADALEATVFLQKQKLIEKNWHK